MRLRAVLAALSVLLITARPAAAWPDRPVTLIVPFAAGSAFDIVGRLMLPRLSATLGQPVVVQNVGGAGGSIGVERAVRANDGHTLLLSGDAAIVVRPSMAPPLPYDPQRDLLPILQVAVTPTILAVPASSPFRSVADVVAAARAQPGTLTYGHPGPGTSIHIGSEMLSQMANIELTGVAYSGVPQMMQDLLEGRISMAFTQAVVAGPQIRDGRLRALGVSSGRRLDALPDVPTIAEQGYAGFDVVAWTGFFAPARTPAAVVEQVHRATAEALADPAVRERLTGMGAIVTGIGPAEFQALIAREIPRMGAVVRAGNIRAE